MNFTLVPAFLKLSSKSTRIIITIFIISLIIITFAVQPIRTNTQSANQVSTGVGFTQQLSFRPNAHASMELFQNAIDDIASQGFKSPWIRLDIDNEVIFPRTNINTTTINCTNSQPINCNPQALDAYYEALAYAQSQGVKVMGIFTTPYWAKVFSEPINEWERTYSLNVYLRINASSFQIVAQKYHTVIDKWQIFNEANYHAFDSYEVTNISLVNDTSYMSMLNRIIQNARIQIRQFDNDPISTNAGGFPYNQSLHNSWISYFNQIRNSIDEIGLDMYPNKNLSEIIQIPTRVNQFSARYRMPVMITEIGMCADNINQTDEDQALYVPQYIEQSSLSNATHIFAYQYQDNMDRPNQCEQNFGIIDEFNIQKSGYNAVMNALQIA